jgi:hypothetical protein
VEDVVDAFSDAHLGWPLILRMIAATLLLCITWKTRNRMFFDSVNTTTAEFFASVHDHLTLWLVRTVRRIDCAPWSMQRGALTSNKGQGLNPDPLVLSVVDGA